MSEYGQNTPEQTVERQRSREIERERNKLTNSKGGNKKIKQRTERNIQTERMKLFSIATLLFCSPDSVLIINSVDINIIIIIIKSV